MMNINDKIVGIDFDGTLYFGLLRNVEERRGTKWLTIFRPDHQCEYHITAEDVRTVEEFEAELNHRLQDINAALEFLHPKPKYFFAYNEESVDLCPAGHLTYWWVVREDFWNKHHYIDDQHISRQLKEDGYEKFLLHAYEAQESLFEVEVLDGCDPIEKAREYFKSFGMEEIQL